MYASIMAMGLIMSIAVCLSVVCKRRIEDTIPLSIFVLIYFLYITALCMVDLGMRYVLLAYFVLGGGSIIITAVAFICSKSKETLFQNIITPGLFVYLGFATFLYFMCNGRLNVYWDEFSHWGLTVKNMYYLDKLSVFNRSTTFFKSYPPALALLQYFFVRPGKNVWLGYQEGATIFAFNMMMLSLLIPLTKFIKRKGGLNPLCAALVIFLVPMVKAEDGGLAWTTIYSDLMLSIQFCYILTTYFIRKEENYFSLFSIISAMGIMCLTKETGVALAFICIFIIFADRFLYNRHGFVHRNWFILVMSIGFVLGIKYSWDAYCIYAGAKRVWKYDSIDYVAKIISLIIGNEEIWRYDVILHFSEYLGKRINFANAVVSLSCVGYIALWYFLMQIHCWISRCRNKTFSLWALSSVSFAVYLGSLLLLYLYSFSQQEALDCASFARYVSIFSTGMTAFWIYYVFAAAVEQDNPISLQQTVATSVCILTLLAVVPIPNVMANVVAMPISRQYTVYEREKYMDVRKLQNRVDIDEKVYLVNQGEQFAYYVNSFEIAPIRTNGFATLTDVSADKLAEELIKGNYSYMYVYKTDEYFLNQYSILFENATIEEKMFYEIEVLNGESVLLKKTDW